MYSKADSYWLSGIFSGSPTLRRRVQKRQYVAQTGLTRNSTRSGYRCVMFGTGESPSSSSESITPSTTSSSWTVGHVLLPHGVADFLDRRQRRSA